MARSETVWAPAESTAPTVRQRALAEDFEELGVLYPFRRSLGTRVSLL